MKNGAGQEMATVTVFDHYSLEGTTSGGRFLQERWTEFDARFSRCYGLLHFVARRILGSSEGADHVIENCRAEASQSCLEFEQKERLAAGSFELTKLWLFFRGLAQQI